MIEEKNAFERNMCAIESIKDRLWSIVSELEEEGFRQKAKSLDTLIGKLEAWQHTGGKRRK